MFYFKLDAMTQRTCQTPKVGSSSGRHSDSNACKTPFDNRIVGVEVCCGPIEGYFLYHNDNMMVTGSDFMLECTRQAMADLAQLLKDYKLPNGDACPMILPKRGALAFDNCPSENKVQVHFTFELCLLL
jgi:hypothetical protein